MRDRLVAALAVASDEQTLDEWFAAIGNTTKENRPWILDYGLQKNLVIQKFREIQKSGISARQLGNVMEIPHQTISKWLKL